MLMVIFLRSRADAQEYGNITWTLLPLSVVMPVIFLAVIKEFYPPLSPPTLPPPFKWPNSVPQVPPVT